MTAAEFPPGIDAEVWEEVEWGDWALTKADERLLIGSPYRYFVRREPTPTMPVLPSAGVRLVDLLVEHLDASGHFERTGSSERFVQAIDIVRAIRAAGYLTRSEWAESVGVEELREARNRWQRDVDLDSLDEAVIDFLARVDGSR